MTNNTAGVVKGFPDCGMKDAPSCANNTKASYAKTVSFNLTNNASIGGSHVVKYNASDSRLNAAAKA